MLTQDEFQTKYHDFAEMDREKAIKTLVDADDEGIENEKPCLVNFGELGYGLMLRKAAVFMMGALGAANILFVSRAEPGTGIYNLDGEKVAECP